MVAVVGAVVVTVVSVVVVTVVAAVVVAVVVVVKVLGIQMPHGLSARRIAFGPGDALMRRFDLLRGGSSTR